MVENIGPDQYNIDSVSYQEFHPQKGKKITPPGTGGVTNIIALMAYNLMNR